MKTSELTGSALDWAVAKCEQTAGMNIREGYGGSLLVVDGNDFGAPAAYSTNWAQGGPVIEREEIMVYKRVDRPWTSTAYRYGVKKKLHGKTKCTIYHGDGPTPLIAAMRCYVASKLGDNVDVPEELQ